LTLRQQRGPNRHTPKTPGVLGQILGQAKGHKSDARDPRNAGGGCSHWGRAI
jgi:hypothetical protein